MNRREVVDKTKDFVRNRLEGEGSGHDWWHIERVYNNALNIAQEEKDADIFIVELAALLHDIADWKFHNGDLDRGSVVSREFLDGLGVEEDIIKAVTYIVKNVSFKGAGEKGEMNSLEGMIVQDADRLDAIGAIGIARAFAYGGNKNREMYNPEIKPENHENFEAYKNSKGTTVNHFYEKLLLLKDLMNTKKGKLLAQNRHDFMETYLNQFYREWNGED